VQSSTDVDEWNALARKLPRIGIGQTFRPGELLIDATQFVDARQVRRRRDERHGPRFPERRLPDVHQPHVWIRGRESPEILDRLVISDQLGVGADGMTEHRCRCWQRLRSGDTRRRERGSSDKSDEHRARHQNLQGVVMQAS
jgi:hypothetical protein